MPDQRFKTRLKNGQLAMLAVVLVVGLGVGAIATRLLGSGGGSGGSGGSSSGGQTASGGVDRPDPDALAELGRPGQPVPPDQANDAQKAVTGFLAAEAAQDFEASFAFLSSADRQKYADKASWIQEHGKFPQVTAFRIDGSTPEGQDVRVTTLTGFQPGLDEVLGLTSARARSTWMTVRENGVWRIDLGRSSTQPLYPSDAPAREVARQWAQRRAACKSTEGLEVRLKGIPTLAERLCGARGEVRLGQVSKLFDTDDTRSLVSAYGPDVFAWARTVQVDSPEPMQIVLAPVGADWKVMGVIRVTVPR